MCCYRYFLLAVVLFGSFNAASGQDRVFEGPWKTTNRKLDGIMTAVIKDLGDERWQGRFYGVWQGVPFDYTVKFSGKPESLKGTAVIDFADYTWTGAIDEDAGTFTAKFGGSRYTGHFEMKEKKKGSAAATAAIEKINR
ncbi:hypothetical protein [Anatilimnocola floriformis]|uniref:hypothetical protein n=1 Tax=Anatilimnocola floriformis TaxID=2948575 RepID=UPI0020C4472D|nr:hypothetical protein [Anatilimnocola floriformis]